MRKNWKMWITAVLVTVLVCFAAGIITAGAETSEEAVETAVTKSVVETGETSLELDIDTEKAAEDFVNRIMYPSKRMRGSTPIGNKLTGASRNLYLKLREDISAVAQGNRSSTVLSYPVADIYEQIIFTGTELGVDPVAELDSDGYYILTQEAMTATTSQLIAALDVSSVIDALLADCSFDFYWYDKTKSTPWIYADGGYGPNNALDSSIVYGNVIVYLPVSSEYANADYETNPVYGQSAVAAAANAQAIVNQHESENNYNRLLSYKNAICEMTAYNHDAAGDKSTPYGNPWQLVWVFDGNEDTTVVCEGYSKAFKYLNDLSKKAGTDVILASGTMAGGTGAGAHMWNIVQMEDGLNYLVDVTNCDTGTAGYPDYLFMKTPISGGSVTEGYAFTTINNGQIQYICDEKTKRLGEDRITLASTGYLDNPKLYIDDLENLTSFESGESFTVNAQYIAGDTEGVSLRARLYKDGAEEIENEQVLSADNGAFNYQLWMDYQPWTSVDEAYRLVIAALKNGEEIASEEIQFTVTAECYFFQPNISKYWQIPTGGDPYQLALDYGDDENHIPDHIDIQVTNSSTDETVCSEVGVEPSYVAIFPIQAGETYNVRVVNYKQGYQVTTYTMWYCQPVIGTLEKPGLVLPESVVAGEPVTGTLIGAENAGRYQVQVYDSGTGYHQCTNYFTQDGKANLVELGLDGAETTAASKEYRFEVIAYPKGGADYAPSETAVYTLTVTGNRPEAPTVTPPEGTFVEGEYAWYTVTGTGMEAAVQLYYYGGEIYQAVDGTVTFPVLIASWPKNIVFRGLVNGRWSEQSKSYTLVGEEASEPDVSVDGPTVTITPEAPQRGQNLRVDVTPIQVDGEAIYAYSFGRLLSSTDYGDFVMESVDQIAYDAPFDIGDGGFTIQGCNLFEAGEYSLTVTVYGDANGGWRSETIKHFTVTENTDLPAAPGIELLTTENKIYGTSRFRITTESGADKLYAFISLKDDTGLDENPIEVAIDPNETSHIFEWQSTNRGTYIAYFSVSRNGVWSDTAEPVTFTVTMENEDLFDGKELRYPDEVTIGEPLTFSWDAANPVDYYEVYADVDGDLLCDQRLDPSVTSITIDTSKATHSGAVYFEVRAYAAGYYWSNLYTEDIALLDPALKIVPTVTRVEDTALFVHLHLTNVQANRIRVKVDGKVTGMYGLGANDGTADIKILAPSLSSTIQVANYDIDPRKWGTWSNPVTATSTAIDPAKTLYLPADLKRIETGAFEGGVFEAVIIPDGCAVLEAGAFANCTKLKYVSYKQGTSGIDGAFTGCGEITWDVR